MDASQSGRVRVSMAGGRTDEELGLVLGEGYRRAEEHLMHLQLGRSFLCGPHAADDLIRLHWYIRESDGVMVGKVWFGPGVQGPPGHAHGGSMAAVLDEALGSACWASGYGVVAAELNTKFKAMLPLGRTVTAEAWVESVDGRKIYPRGRLFDEDAVYAEADGLFITLDERQLEFLGLQR